MNVADNTNTSCWISSSNIQVEQMGVLDNFRTRDVGAAQPADRLSRKRASWRIEDHNGLEAGKTPEHRATRRKDSPTRRNSQHSNRGADCQAPDHTVMGQIIVPVADESVACLPIVMDAATCASPPKQTRVSESEGGFQSSLTTRQREGSMHDDSPARKANNFVKPAQPSSRSRSIDSISSSKQQRTFALTTMSEIAASPARSETSEMYGPEEHDTKHSRFIRQSDDGSRLLACPYVKLDPTEHSGRNVSATVYRRCNATFLKDISRLKQHMYRVHLRPRYHCSRCFITFPDAEELKKHEKDAACLAKQCPFDEKITNRQLRKFQQQRAIANERVQSWFAIFSILFPDAPLPSSPFLDIPRPDPHSGLLNVLEQFRESFSEKLRIKGDLPNEQKETVDKLLKETKDEMVSSLQLESPGAHFPRQQQPFVFEARSDSVFQGDPVGSNSSTMAHTDIWSSLPSSHHSSSAHLSVPETRLDDFTDLYVDPRLLQNHTDDFDLPALSRR